MVLVVDYCGYMDGLFDLCNEQSQSSIESDSSPSNARCNTVFIYTNTHTNTASGGELKTTDPPARTKVGRPVACRPNRHRLQLALGLQHRLGAKL